MLDPKSHNKTNGAVKPMGSYFEDRMAELGANPPKHKALMVDRRRAPEPEPTGKIGNIYFAVADDHVKIGFATDMTSRLRSLRTGNHLEIHIHESFNSYQAAEKMLHKHFKKDHIRGEWFKMSFEIEDLWDDIMDYQGMHTHTANPDAPGSGMKKLAAMSHTFIPLGHLKKILAYSGKPWPEGLFADPSARPKPL